MLRPDEGMSRRSFLKAGAIAATAVGMTDLLIAPVDASPHATIASAGLLGAPLDQAMTIVDSHCHATPVWYGDIDALIFEMDRNKVQHAMLVQIGGYFNNDYQ